MAKMEKIEGDSCETSSPFFHNVENGHKVDIENGKNGENMFAIYAIMARNQCC